MTEEASVDSLLRQVAAAPALPLDATLVLEPGTVVDETFVISERLGAGGMGVVYAARDRELDREVALKFMRFEIAASPRLAHAFEREARATARLNHPHVVTLHRIGRWQLGIYLVLERLRGETLAARLARGPLSVAEMTRIVTQIVAALEHMHGARVMHRDLKPQNIFLVDGEHVKILDFGVSGLVRAVEASGAGGSGDARSTMAHAGTPGYMAPEQWRGDAVDHHTDIWALGAMMVEMLTGRLPFGTRPLAEDDAIDRLPLRAVPRRIATLIRRCLAREPGARPDAAKVAACLRGAWTIPRWFALALVTVIAIGGALGARLAASESPRCEVGDRVHGFWNADVAAALRARIAADGDPVTLTKLAELTRFLDNEAAEWARVWRASCDVPATRACLETQRAKLGRVVGALASVTRANLQRALTETLRIERANECEDPQTAALIASNPTPAIVRAPEPGVRAMWTFGGSNQDNVHDLAELPDGDLVVVGYLSLTATWFGRYIVETQAFERTGSLVRMRPDGSVAWTFEPRGKILAVEKMPSGDLAIAGVLDHDVRPGGSNPRSGWQCFVGVVDGARGTLRWEKPCRSKRSLLHDLAVDGDGNIYGGGHFGGTLELDGLRRDARSSLESAPFAASWTAGGELRWVTAGADTEMARTQAIAVRDGVLVIAATSWGDGTFAGRAIRDGCTIVRLDPRTGEPAWFVDMPSRGPRRPGRCYVRALDIRGDRIAAGGANDSAAWMTELAVTDGRALWHRKLGAQQTEVRAVGYLADGTLIAAGSHEDEAIEIDGVTLANMGSTDAFALAFDGTGRALRGLRWGGTSADKIRTLHVGPTGRLWVGGRFQPRMRVGGVELRSGPASDAFILELEPTLQAPRLSVAR